MTRRPLRISRLSLIQRICIAIAADVIEVPLAFALPRDELQFTALVNTWIDLMRTNGTMQELCEYWILGRSAASRPPRWSIIREVLHWVP